MVRVNGMSGNMVLLKEEHGGNYIWKLMQIQEILSPLLSYAAVVPDLLEQIKSNVSESSADGAYDKTKAREALYKYDTKQVIPPAINTVTQDDTKNIILL